MDLRNITVKQSYRTSIDDIPKDFYNPILSCAVKYDRAVGFFSSTIFSRIYPGISALVNNGGRIRIVASPKLSNEDIDAIRQGYKLRDSVIREVILRELHEPISLFEKKCLNQLASLIADNLLDIRIAFTEKSDTIGMYHEKMGLISDELGNTVAFSGSMNESLTAVSLNYESIDVFCSWKSQEELNRIMEKKESFELIWSNRESEIRVIEFSELKDEIIKRYRRQDLDFYEIIDEESNYVMEDTPPTKNCVRIPEDFKLHDYQVSAIDEWEKNNYRGIFDMATGTGKTYTGLGALSRIYHNVPGKLSAIIVCPYQHLVEQWVSDIEYFNVKPIIGYSSSSQKNWLKLLEDAIRDQKLSVKNKDFFCFVTTNATFSTEKVQTLLNKVNSNLLLIVDEAHNFGAEHLSKLLTERYRYRLALSATLDRHNDPAGTSLLYGYFGNKCIEYTLERAIQENKLTRYKYYPIITKLNEQELSVYSQLSYEISKCLIGDGKKGLKLSERGKRLALKRSRIVAGAVDKLDKLIDHIGKYIDERHILVYCGATSILTENQDDSEVDMEDIRQIDAVTAILGNHLEMSVAQFTSREDIQKRERLKKEFESGEDLQVLVAIKCLDEGVNIPKIKTAFILASTTNPKEYIQRRGRVLRLAKGKDFAEIYDFITLPRELDEVQSITEHQRSQELRLVKNEISRAREFARLSMNMAQAENVIDQIMQAYSLNDFLICFEEDVQYDEH